MKKKKSRVVIMRGFGDKYGFQAIKKVRLAKTKKDVERIKRELRAEDKWIRGKKFEVVRGGRLKQIGEMWKLPQIKKWYGRKKK